MCDLATSLINDCDHCCPPGGCCTFSTVSACQSVHDLATAFVHECSGDRAASQSAVHRTDAEMLEGIVVLATNIHTSLELVTSSAAVGPATNSTGGSSSAKGGTTITSGPAQHTYEERRQWHELLLLIPPGGSEDDLFEANSGARDGFVRALVTCCAAYDKYGRADAEKSRRDESTEETTKAAEVALELRFRCLKCLGCILQIRNAATVSSTALSSSVVGFYLPRLALSLMSAIKMDGKCRGAAMDVVKGVLPPRCPRDECHPGMVRDLILVPASSGNTATRTAAAEFLAWSVVRIFEDHHALSVIKKEGLTPSQWDEHDERQRKKCEREVMKHIEDMHEVFDNVVTHAVGKHRLNSGGIVDAIRAMHHVAPKSVESQLKRNGDEVLALVKEIEEDERRDDAGQDGEMDSAQSSTQTAQEQDDQLPNFYSRLSSPPIFVRSEREMQVHMETIKAALNETDADQWSRRFNALVDLERMLAGGIVGQSPEMRMAFLAILKRLPIAAQVLDLRSQITRQACRFITGLALEVRNAQDHDASHAMAQFVEQWLPSLHKLCISGVRLMATQGMKCLFQLVALGGRYGYPRVVNLLCEGCTTKKAHQNHKRGCILALTAALRVWGIQSLERNLEHIVKAVCATLSDRDPTVREEGRKAFWAFFARDSFRSLADDLLMTLDGRERKRLQKLKSGVDSEWEKNGRMGILVLTGVDEGALSPTGSGGAGTSSLYSQSSAEASVSGASYGGSVNSTSTGAIAPRRSKSRMRKERGRAKSTGRVRSSALGEEERERRAAGSGVDGGGSKVYSSTIAEAEGKGAANSNSDVTKTKAGQSSSRVRSRSTPGKHRRVKSTPAIVDEVVKSSRGVLEPTVVDNVEKSVASKPTTSTRTGKAQEKPKEAATRSTSRSRAWSRTRSTRGRSVSKDPKDRALSKARSVRARSASKDPKDRPKAKSTDQAQQKTASTSQSTESVEQQVKEVEKPGGARTRRLSRARAGRIRDRSSSAPRIRTRSQSRGPPVQLTSSSSSDSKGSDEPTAGRQQQEQQQPKEEKEAPKDESPVVEPPPPPPPPPSPSNDAKGKSPGGARSSVPPPQIRLGSQKASSSLGEPKAPLQFQERQSSQGSPLRERMSSPLRERMSSPLRERMSSPLRERMSSQGSGIPSTSSLTQAKSRGSSSPLREREKSRGMSSPLRERTMPPISPQTSTSVPRNANSSPLRERRSLLVPPLSSRPSSPMRVKTSLAVNTTSPRLSSPRPTSNPPNEFVRSPSPRAMSSPRSLSSPKADTPQIFTLDAFLELVNDTNNARREQGLSILCSSLENDTSPNKAGGGVIDIRSFTSGTAYVTQFVQALELNMLHKNVAVCKSALNACRACFKHDRMARSLTKYKATLLPAVLKSFAIVDKSSGVSGGGVRHHPARDCLDSVADATAFEEILRSATSVLASHVAAVTAAITGKSASASHRVLSESAVLHLLETTRSAFAKSVSSTGGHDALVAADESLHLFLLRIVELMVVSKYGPDGLQPDPPMDIEVSVCKILIIIFSVEVNGVNTLNDHLNRLPGEDAKILQECIVTHRGDCGVNGDRSVSDCTTIDEVNVQQHNPHILNGSGSGSDEENVNPYSPPSNNENAPPSARSDLRSSRSPVATVPVEDTKDTTKPRRETKSKFPFSPEEGKTPPKSGATTTSATTTTPAAMTTATTTTPAGGTPKTDPVLRYMAHPSPLTTEKLSKKDDGILPSIVRKLSTESLPQEQFLGIQSLVQFAKDNPNDPEWELNFADVLSCLLDGIVPPRVPAAGNDGDSSCASESEIQPALNASKHLFLQGIRALLKQVPNLFEDHVDAVMDKLLECSKSGTFEIKHIADRALESLVQSLNPVHCLKSLMRFVNDAIDEDPNSPATTSLLLSGLRTYCKVVDRVPSKVLLEALPSIIPCVNASMQHKAVDMRKAAVFAIVETYYVLGEVVLRRFDQLNAAQLKLVSIYIERHEKAG